MTLEELIQLVETEGFDHKHEVVVLSEGRFIDIAGLILVDGKIVLIMPNREPEGFHDYKDDDSELQGGVP